MSGDLSEIPHPSKDKTTRHPTDQLIRSKGFRIAERKGDQEPVWERNGKRYSQSEVLVIINRGEVSDAYCDSVNVKKGKKK